MKLMSSPHTSIKHIIVNGRRKKLQEYVISCHLCNISVGRIQHPINSHSANYYSHITYSKRKVYLKGKKNHNMNLDSDCGILYVDSTATIKECQDFVLPHNFSFPINVGSSLITVGGAFNVGKHSAMFEEDDVFFASYVNYVEFMDAHGQIHQICDEDLLFYLRGSFGIFGITLRLGIKLKRPTFTKQSIEIYKGRYDCVPKNTEGVGFISQLNVRIRTSKNKINDTGCKDSEQSKNNYWGEIVNNNIPPNLLYRIQNLSSSNKLLGGAFNVFSYVLSTGETSRGTLGDALPAVPSYDVAFTIPQNKIHGFMLQYEMLINKYQHFRAYPVRTWVRYLPPTSKYLFAYNYQKNPTDGDCNMVCMVEAVFSHKMPKAHRFLRALGNLMMRMDGVPHMGKTILPNWDYYLQEIYQKKIKDYDSKQKFKELIDKYDPKRIFSNKSLRYIFFTNDPADEADNFGADIFQIYD